MLINKKSPHGGDIYTYSVRLDLSANLNPFGMPKPIVQALIDTAARCEAYPDPYCTALRRKISMVEGIPETFCLIGNGAAELIYSFSYTLPKDRPALILSPTFCEYEQALSAAGIESEHMVMTEEDGFRPTEALLKRDFSRYSAVFLCSPNNPTGITIDPGIVHAIAQSGVRLFCDFSFLDLTEQSDRYHIQQFLREAPNLTVLRSFTKSYAMAGVRLGYVLCSDEDFLAQMSDKVQCWNVSTLSQVAGEAALDCSDWLRTSVLKISAERERLKSELTVLGIRVYAGEANYLLLYSEKNLFDLLLRRGIMVRDCSDYVGLGRGYVRVAIRTAKENDLFLTELKEVLK